MVSTAFPLVFLEYNRGYLKYRSFSCRLPKNIFINVYMLPVICDIAVY